MQEIPRHILDDPAAQTKVEDLVDSGRVSVDDAWRTVLAGAQGSLLENPWPTPEEGAVIALGAAGCRDAMAAQQLPTSNETEPTPEEVQRAVDASWAAAEAAIKAKQSAHDRAQN